MRKVLKASDPGESWWDEEQHWWEFPPGTTGDLEHYCCSLVLHTWYIHRTLLVLINAVLKSVCPPCNTITRSQDEHFLTRITLYEMTSQTPVLCGCIKGALLVSTVVSHHQAWGLILTSGLCVCGVLPMLVGFPPGTLASSNMLESCTVGWLMFPICSLQYIAHHLNCECALLWWT